MNVWKMFLNELNKYAYNKNNWSLVNNEKNKQFHIWFKDCFEKHIESIMDHASKPINIFK
jgi:hypothetical protein